MKPKTKRKLKWVVEGLGANMDGTYYWVMSLPSGLWFSGCDEVQCFQGKGPYVTKRQAIAACEKHAREKGRK